ncbi:DUF4157 domain-containing protein [Edaphobacter sp. HDX4]|uniref:eCIS core domain-containing protein n=1 Tax=Edaphobacter sp. HDX4 TaxID=2794064 RepID=UPI002FE5775B
MVLQRKLVIGASKDPLELEADWVADHVMATPAHPVSGALPRIQRFSGQSNEQMDAAPASVERVLASSGRPLEPALQQNMGKRFGHDFSLVRVHSDTAAKQSALDVQAHAYTVGNNIVFGEGRFAPETHEGQRLLAHELTHVVQQSGQKPKDTHQNVCYGPFEAGSSTLSPFRVEGRTSRQVARAPFSEADIADLRRWGVVPPAKTPDHGDSPAVAKGQPSNSHSPAPPGLGPKPRQTEKELYDAFNADPHRKKPTQETEAPGDEAVIKMTPLERLWYAVQKAKEPYHDDVKAEIDALFTKQAVAVMAFFAALYVAALIAGPGWIANGIALAAMTISIVFVGTLLFQIMADLGTFVSALNARTFAQLNNSGEALSRAIAKANVAVIVALLTHSSKGAGTAYDGPTPPGNFDAVTPDGLVVRAPAEAFDPKILPAKGLASTGADKKPSEPTESKGNKSTAEQRAAETAARKETLSSQIGTIEDTRTKIQIEIDELDRQIQGAKLGEEKTALIQKKAALLKERQQASVDQFGLRQQIGRLGRALYLACRLFSVLENVRKDVFQSAAKANIQTKKIEFIDQISGKVTRDPTVEHIVSVDEISEMAGFKELGEFERTGELSDAQKEVLSTRANLMIMDRGLNSSKGNQSWATWKFGRDFYGAARADEMLAQERKLKVDIQKDIENRRKQRTR